MNDTKTALEQAREALRSLILLIRRNAPDLSGKTIGQAEAAIASIDAALSQAVAPEKSIRDLIDSARVVVPIDENPVGTSGFLQSLQQPPKLDWRPSQCRHGARSCEMCSICSKE